MAGKFFFSLFPLFFPLFKCSSESTTDGYSHRLSSFCPTQASQGKPRQHDGLRVHRIVWLWSPGKLTSPRSWNSRGAAGVEFGSRFPYKDRIRTTKTDGQLRANIQSRGGIDTAEEGNRLLN
ncbi:hypothetical protein ASPWEDRAFT_243786 [Aspergillus wentii DTO 134E9]|uniref:Secreted protein n=1 Tax=Aspergillus wentii DTO 134E9 TaxID=1073089 RepID=A0A1L9S1Q6_ASPWE|nr:uncharacterized protein ASPWEDRAFT_243786 [Aspergillus wentii DTO 134E9]OJJ41090.1 hypothetical protein ASPWEDRAFT_243786 [Aspergillus wentii DTO 134E9]